MKLLKALAVFLVLGIAFWAIKTWYVTTFAGNLINNGGTLFQVFSFAIPFVIVFGVFYAIRGIIRFKSDFSSGSLNTLALLAMVTGGAMLSGCSAAHSNVQTLVTDNCGVSWKVIRVGETLPPMMGVCSYKVTIPDYPMQGEVKFKTSFKNRVLANIEVAYDYMITDGIQFVGEAKYIGKMNSDGDDSSNKSSAYESAENSVIDKRIREVASTHLLTQDIVDFSQGEFEDMLLAEVNKLLANKGVKLNFISFVPIPEEQTRLAIDVLTAHKVYESKGLGELGQRIIVARSGAAKITFSNETPQPAQKEKD